MLDNINNYRNYLLESGKSENTIYAYVTDVTLYLKFLNRKNIDIYKTNSSTITMYVHNLLERGKSERSINRIIISLRNFYNYIKKEGLIKEVPKIEYKSSKNIRKLPQILTIEEVDRIIKIIEKDSTKGLRDNALLELMYATGMKVSEIIGINIDDINLELNYVRCRDNKNYERLIPIGRSASKALTEYLGVRYKIADCGVKNLFVNLNGQKLTRQGIWRIVKEYSKKAGIEKDVNLNTFRHSFAVHLLQNGANVRAVQKLLGNQVLTYMDTYYEIINNDKINYIYMHTHPRA